MSGGASVLKKETVDVVERLAKVEKVSDSRYRYVLSKDRWLR